MRSDGTQHIGMERGDVILFNIIINNDYDITSRAFLPNIW